MTRFIIQVKDPGYIKGRKPNPYFIQAGSPTYPIVSTDVLKWAMSFKSAVEAVEYIANIAQKRGLSKGESAAYWHKISGRYQFSLLQTAEYSEVSREDQIKNAASIVFVPLSGMRANADTRKGTSEHYYVHGHQTYRSVFELGVNYTILNGKDFPVEAGVIILDATQNPKWQSIKDFQAEIDAKAAQTPKSRVKEMLANAGMTAEEREATRQAEIQRLISAGHVFAGSL
jgi:hypothetical protein